MFREIILHTTQKEEVVDITDQVEQVVASSSTQEAGVFIYVPHPDAAVNIQGSSFQDPP